MRASSYILTSLAVDSKNKSLRIVKEKWREFLQIDN